MEASTTIRGMISNNRIFVPDYQRAYSWDTAREAGEGKKQTNVFISDLEDYIKSSARTPYYFGHFLFEQKARDRFGVIDGQQRLTTIVIFLSALFARLEALRALSEEEKQCKEDIIKRGSIYRFETVGYDDQFFKDYVIDGVKKDQKGLETESAKRVVAAFDFFTEYLSSKEESLLLALLNSIVEASCTTHPVHDESEAIQMFIFQNNRGKKPSNLEIIKAQFMFTVHLHAGEEKEALVKEIKTRFEKIYKSISEIEYKINEDEVLVYTLRVHFNSLWEGNAVEKINRLLAEKDSIVFIKEFTRSLAQSFECLTTFFGKDEREHIEIHSLVTLGGISVAIPFILKAYKFGVSTEAICRLCVALESLVLRDRLIGTRAEITSRLNDVYQKFTEDSPKITPVIERIEWMKRVPQSSWWWAYWNNSELEKSIQGGLNRSTAKFLLWKYENYLESKGKNGYTFTRFDKIKSPELEHIAPQTPTNGEPVAAGYCEYDEEFRHQYIDCLGNYLLLSKSHNCSVGNKPFSEKLETYDHLAQQREIKEMTEGDLIWSKELIRQRKSKIVEFILNSF